MKRLMQKQTMKKIIILIVVVLSFNFVVPTYSQAGFGGVLMGPIIDFIAGVGDAVTSALQYFMYDGNITTGNTVGGAVKGFLTLINPLTNFLLGRDEDNFEEKLKEYGLDAEGETPDIEIDTEQFDKGWFSWFWDKEYGIPIIKYTPEKIFANQVPALDVNFIDPMDWTEVRDANGEQVFQNADIMNERSITIALHETIATWYVALRNLAIVALLSVLLYVGVRMVMSSVAADKSKYKQMLIDWVVALCIVFFLHYIMSFILSVTSMITEGVDSGTEIVVKALDDDGDIQFKTDLTGLCRFQIQYEDLGGRFVYLVMYIALVVYTVMFTFIYVRRAITMALLTLMAPLVAITYPIDKIGDGKAQAFGVWLREFMFNALLQPFHLIIYTIFMGASSQIAVQNPIYAILFLAFIIPSEKLMRKMFGFDKSDTTGAFGAAAGAFGGAAAFKMLSSTINKARGKGGAPSGGKDTIKTKTPIEDKSLPDGYAAFASGPVSSASRRITSGNAANVGNTANAPRSSTATTVGSTGSSYNMGSGEEWMSGGSYTIGGDSSTGGNLTPPDFNQAGIGYGGIRMAQQGDEGTAPQSAPEPSTSPTRAATSSELRQRDRVIRAAKTAILGNNTFTKGNAKQMVKAAGRGAIRVATGTAGLALGVGMGIAGGDIQDVLTYGAAGATLGTKALGDVAIRGGSRVKGAMSNRAYETKEAYYGVNAAAIRKQTAEFTKDEDRIDYFATEFAEGDQRLSGDALKSVMNRAAFYNNAKITDNSAIKKSIKLEDSIMKDLEIENQYSEEQKREMARNRSLAIAKLADSVDENDLRTNAEYVKGLQESFKRSLKKENPNLGEGDLDAQSEYMLNLLRKYKKID